MNVRPGGRGRRPLVLIPGRFSQSASALRFEAVVVARTLAQAVRDGGGEPVVVLPTDRREVACLAWADAVLLPGGGDVDPAAYGQRLESDEVYGVDGDQDCFDIALARWALAEGMPLLAICRGLQVLNVALGGTLRQHLERPHLVVSDLAVDPTSRLAALLGTSELRGSCHHHQGVAAVAPGLQAVAWQADGTIEGLEPKSTSSFVVGVQWHPEDTYGSDPAQLALFTALAGAARQRRT